jgi:hypothetical protein
VYYSGPDVGRTLESLRYNEPGGMYAVTTGMRDLTCLDFRMHRATRWVRVRHRLPLTGEKGSTRLQQLHL